MLYLGNREPPLDEVFDDPIVRLLMARDGLPPDKARAYVERVRAALRDRAESRAVIGGSVRAIALACSPCRMRSI